MRFLMTVVFFTMSVSCLADEAIRHYFESLNSGYELPVHGDDLVATEDLKTFYEEHNYQPAWYSDGKLTSIATELYLAIETAAIDGLQPADYHNRALQKLCPAEQTEDTGYCDLLFTDAFFILAQHLSTGKVNPKNLTVDWPGEERRKDLVSLLNDALAENTIKNVLASLRPDQLGYERLTAILKRLRVATRYPEWSPLALSPPIEPPPIQPPSPALQPGQTDERLAAIIERLVFWGDMQAPSTPIDHYDEVLQQAVQRFQRRHGLKDDGVIGDTTLAAFNVDPTQRAQQIIANMERRRWLPKELGNKHLRVNIAELKLLAIKHNQAIFTQPITLGRHYQHQPVFSGKIRYLVLNPDWTVPLELAVKELLPKLKSDPQSLVPLGFSIFADGTQVAPETIDWTQVNPKNFGYRLVQAPGPRNAMGEVKFAFPSEYTVYLHGSPTENLFQDSQQGFSAGSIRVDAPLELAAWLLEDAARPKERLEAMVSTGKTETIYPLSPIPVHIEYRTAWVNSQGVLNFREDIYQRDQRLYERLMKSIPSTP